MRHDYSLWQYAYLGVLLLTLTGLPALSQTVRYVRTDGTNTNPASATSWATATADLRGAINASSAGQQVWVKVGTYVPSGTSGRDNTFSLKEGVAIYGSFRGIETTVAQRGTPGIFGYSILSGEIGNLSIPDDNCYHVVSAMALSGQTLSAAAVLDGFQIIGGNANGNISGTNIRNSGGGMYILANGPAAPTIRNCLFQNNKASRDGGAIYAASLNLGVVSASVAPVITNCTFTSNTAVGGGGAVLSENYTSGGTNSVSIGGCTFSGNRAAEGGAIYTKFSESVGITNSTFSDNRASSIGGAIFHARPPANTTHTNCLFESNTASKGGAIWNDQGGSSFMNCMFRSNRADVDGGAVLNNTSSILFMNCGFTGNSAGINAGAIYNQGGSTPSSPIQTFRNCSFVNNSAGSTNSPTTGNGAIVCSQFGTVVMTNSIVYNSGGNKTFYRDPQYQLLVNNSLIDAAATNYINNGNVFTTFTSPFTDETLLTIQPCSPALNGSTNATTGNLGTTDLANGARFVGSTADLGAVEYQSTTIPAVSAGSIVSSAGTNSIICTNATLPTINNQNSGFSVQKTVWETRLNNTGSWSVVAGVTSLNLASPGSMSASTSSISFRRVAYDCTGNPQYTNVITYVQSNTVITVGVIAGPAIVPFPQEPPNTLTSQTNASAIVMPITLRWQQSENGTSWTDILNSNSQSISLPALTTGGNARKEFQFRRVTTNGCSLSAVSAPLGVTVIAIPNDSRISGKIVSNDGITGVENITITAVRTTTGLAGSPGSRTYTAVSEADGTYNLTQLYYGLNAGVGPTGSVTASTFIVTPRFSAGGVTHSFNPTSATITLNQFTIPRSGVNFTDLTTYAIAGQAFQSCPDCITGMSGQTPLIGLKTCPLDGVDITVRQPGLTVATRTTGYLSSPAPGDYGLFAATVSNPSAYTILPAYRNQLFTPAFRAVNLTGDLYGQDFTTPTSQTIQGRITAGCNQIIGTATLEFTDVLKDAQGIDRPVCFRKRVTSNAQGYYQIILPPRRYKVSVVSFTATPGGTNPVSATDFTAFVNNQLPADSLTRDLSSTTAVTTLNLTYERPPTLVVEGLVNPPSCGTASAFSLMEQAVDTPLTVRLFQGPANLGCPVSGGLINTSATSGSGNSGTTISGTLVISTTIQDDAGEVLRPGFTNGVANLTLLPGNPNIIAPYTRSLNIQFTDKFGRAAPPFNRPVVVTGTKPGAATFETVSPSIPFMVLHDPPGDLSSSFWEQDTKVETVMKFYSSRTYNQNIWAQLKLGFEYSLGIGISFKVKSAVLLDASTDITEGRTKSHEMVLSTRMVEKIATSSSPSVVGPPGDVFVGGALNLIYSVATTVVPVAGTCSFTTVKDLIIANRGLATKFYYTEAFIRDQVIPNLRNLRDLSVNPLEKGDYERQVSVWEQILANNEHNRSVAPFIINKSFNGGVGEITEYTTQAQSQKNTVETYVEVAEEVAVEAGFDTGGLGFSAGVKLKFKVETGESVTVGETQAVTTGYTLRDSSPNDRFTVDIKTDPVYGTPVFDLLAGETSCPAEPDTRARDNFQFSATQNVVSNIPPDGEAIFTLKLGNISEVITDGSRTATLELLEESNTSGAEIIVNGSPYVIPITYNLGRLSPETEVIVKVRRGNPNVYAYEGLKFKLSGCGGPGTSKTITLSAFFLSPCSSVSLTTPESGWVSTIADNNQLPVHIGGYTLANLTNVTLEYTEISTSNWQTGFTRTAAQLDNTPNGTIVNWNTTGILDGSYALRLKVTCPLGNGATGVMYSQRVEGVFDRTRPNVLGNTQPVSDTYLTGGTIGINYDEPLRCSQISSSNVTAKRRSNGQTVPVSVGCYLNQIVIVPTGSLTPFTGDVISVTLTGIADVYGNARTTPDTWEFYVGSLTAATGPGSVSVTLTNSPLSESATGTMNVVFRLPNAAPNNIFVNFAVSGLAVHGLDYTTSYSPGQPLSATVNGVGGTIMIPKGATSATLLIDPVNETFFEPDETIIITLLDGGDYQIGAASSVTAVILNDDPVGGGNVITSIRTGNWEDAATWDLNRTPLSTDQVIIDQSHTITLTGTGNARKITKRSNAKLRLGAITTRLRLGF